MVYTMQLGYVWLMANLRKKMRGKEIERKNERKRNVDSMSVNHL